MRVRLDDRRCLKHLIMSSILGVLMLGCSSASGNSSQQAAVASPTPDSVTRNYVALVRNYWVQLQTANGVSNGSNEAAMVCLGKVARTAPNNLQLIDPSKCRERAVAFLAVHQKFLSDLDSNPPPPKFAADDQAFRSQLPKAIGDVKAIISVAATGTNDAVLQASTAYIDAMIPIVTDALDDVDPSVVHN
jgi:hypothetical protein